MSLAAIPTFLRIWTALQVLAFIAAPILRPDSIPLIVSFIWTVVMMVLAWAMWKHAKGPWVAAVVLAAFGITGGLPALWTWTDGMNELWLWQLWGLLFSGAGMGVLVSRQARDWVNEPTERKWTYSPSR